MKTMKMTESLALPSATDAGSAGHGQMVATRTAFGDALLELGRANPHVVVIDADVGKSVTSMRFGQAFPDRYFNVGAAEQNMIDIAAGLATTGKTVFACTYGVFASMRACEQVRTFVAYPRLNVKIGASHGGLHTGMDGVTHQATEDIGIMRSIPNMTVLSPSDGVTARLATLAAAETQGPVYIRLGRNPVPVIHSPRAHYQVGKSITWRQSPDDRVTIVATGVMVGKALAAARALEDQRIGARVIEVHTIKPIDRDVIIRAARETRGIVTAEDHNVIGGLGSAVCEVVCEECPTAVRRIGLRDVFGESGDPETLLAAYGLTAQDIIRACLDLAELQ